MAQLYHHRQFRLYSDFRAVNREARFSGGKTTDQMYFLRDKNGATVDVALDYFAFLILVRNLKKVGSEANAIKRFWNFLEENDMRWDRCQSNRALVPRTLTIAPYASNCTMAPLSNQLPANTCEVSLIFISLRWPNVFVSFPVNGYHLTLI